MAGDSSGDLYLGRNFTGVGLYSVNRTTGAASLVGAGSTFDVIYAMAYTNGVMYGVDAINGNIDTVNLTNGTTSVSSSYKTSETGQVWGAAALSPPSSPVPEPSALVIFSGLGAMGLIVAWRRRKRAA
jgi:hypothetical protein